jgi:hypothetical protein
MKRALASILTVASFGPDCFRCSLCVGACLCNLPILH